MKTTWLKSLAVMLGLSLFFASAAWAVDAHADTKGPRSLNQAIYHEMIMLPQLTVFDDLSFKVEDGNVVLSGQVRNAVLKDEATSVVKRIAGVEHVDNRIEILPASFNDDRIRRQTARALFRDTQLFRYSLSPVPSIHIVVRNGHVSLKGVVANQFDKNVAGIRANGVPGVFSVENDLQVERN
jgi:hyperosmotically inducible periplasmic protein